MNVVTFRHLLVLSVVLRVGLIVYSEWHDAHSVVKYTDIDYRVFSDAARFESDPYTRETYRYTPLLAVLLAPNEWVHSSFGKYLFAACDIVNGLLIYALVRTVILPAEAKKKTNTRLAVICSAVHLLNPMVFSISTRGSSESVLCSLVLLTLDAALRGKWDRAALLLGLSTHWKIYPVIYGVSCLAAVGASEATRAPNANVFVHIWRTFVNPRTLRFTLISSAAFTFLGILCYSLWGYPFLYESYLYHLHRRDHRHNFSPYFYLIYLTYHSSDSKILHSPLVSFGPQMLMSFGTGMLFGGRVRDLPFAWFVQTFAFVLFNKVCTSQYFLWYLLFIPLLVPRLHMSLNQALVYIGVWVVTQALWLAEAYNLEFLGESVFLGLWFRSVVYVLGQCWVLTQVMRRCG
ncbi:glycosyltransferase family 50 protein [Fistulina hepatica ATCC 64428]|nr:glycosyltransferase family 50 protein [Fistulina hepatica ATCC 64428]